MPTPYPLRSDIALFDIHPAGAMIAATADSRREGIMPPGGPATPEGKAVASRNAVRHGLYTDAIVASTWESEDEWREFHDAVVDALAPHGELEFALATRAAALFWRLRRAPIAEVDLINRAARRADLIAARAGRVPSGEAPGSGDAGDLSARVPASSAVGALLAEARLGPLIRVEARLNRQLLNTLHRIEVLQEHRNGKGAPLPASMSTDSPGHEK
jgi:hypothetical protein